MVMDEEIQKVEMKDKVEKLIIPLFDAKNVFETIKFDDQYDKVLGIQQELRECDNCGGHTFFIREGFSTNEGYHRLIDSDFVCAECGEYVGGHSIEEIDKLFNEAKKKSKKAVVGK